MQCVILAGGLATRMRPHTEKIPKSLLPVAGHPFLKLQLDWLVAQGVSDVVMCVGYLGEMIQDYAGRGDRWKIRLQYVSEGEHLLGTAGALRLALKTVHLDSEFLILYGDSYLEVPIRPIWNFFAGRSESALMTVLKNNNQWDRSNVNFQEPKVVRYQKNAPPAMAGEMAYVDYGLSILRRKIVENDIPDAVKSDLADVFHGLSLRGDLAGFEVYERFFEIGSPSGLAELKEYLATRQ